MLRDLIAARIRLRGPITVAEFMDLALYHPQLGYYASAARRSGRTGDFYTSVDVGPVFGQLLTAQLEEMWRLLGSPSRFDLVEAGASDGRLARDVLDAAQASNPLFYEAIALHLVDVSGAARAAQPQTLGLHASKLVSSGDALPGVVTGVVLANELLDALPVHVVVTRDHGLHEVRVGLRGDALVEIEGPPSTPALSDYLERLGVRLALNARAEIGLAAEAWMTQVARSVVRGFLVVVDYGREASELYSPVHAAGTLRSFSRHVTDPASTGWLVDPGTRDLTTHVDLTTLRLVAEREGLLTLARLDQTYFLLGLGAAERAGRTTGDAIADLQDRLALKTLLVPGGLGSTHKVLIFGKDVGRPHLACTSFAERMT